VDRDDSLDRVLNYSLYRDNYLLPDGDNNLIWLINVLVYPMLCLYNSFNGDFYNTLSNLLNVSLGEDINFNWDINLSSDGSRNNSLNLFVNVNWVLDDFDLLAEDIDLNEYIVADLVVYNAGLVRLHSESVYMLGMMDRDMYKFLLNHIIVSLLNDFVRDFYDSSVDNVLLDDNLLVDVVELLNLDDTLAGNWLFDNPIGINLPNNSVRNQVFDDLLFFNVNVLFPDHRLLNNHLDDLLAFMICMAGAWLMVLMAVKV